MAVRPHPRFSDSTIISHIFSQIDIENIEKNIEESIFECKYVTSLFSTVLVQAYFNGIKVVIDNITNVDKFKKLGELQYIILNKEFCLLSELISDKKTI